MKSSNIQITAATGGKSRLSHRPSRDSWPYFCEASVEIRVQIGPCRELCANVVSRPSGSSCGRGAAEELEQVLLLGNLVETAMISREKEL